MLNFAVFLQVGGGAEGTQTFIVKFDSNTFSPYNEECVSKLNPHHFCRIPLHYPLKMNSDSTVVKPREKLIMQTNVAQLLKAPVGSIRTFPVDATLAESGTEYHVKGELTLIRSTNSILVQGRLNTQTEFSCSRCLRPFTLKLPLKIQEEFFPTIDIIAGMRLPKPEDPGSFTIDEHHVLDLTEAIRQYIVTAIPMKPLCKEDCAGLCSTCGKDLNLGKCDCKQEEMDPRWAELLKLKKSNKVKIANPDKQRKKVK